MSATPEGYPSVTPYLIVREAARAIEFYKQALGAVELMRLEAGGKIGHAELRIGDSPIMLADEVRDMGYVGPESLGGTPVSLLVYVENVDARFQQALDAGARVFKPVADQFYGDRSGTLIDPFGHIWTLATRQEELAPEEVQRRFEELLKQHASS